MENLHNKINNGIKLYGAFVLMVCISRQVTVPSCLNLLQLQISLILAEISFKMFYSLLQSNYLHEVNLENAEKYAK